MMNNIRILREELKLNMKQTATLLDIPYTTYVSYEKGDREPNGETLIKIAEFFNTTVDFLLGRADALKHPDLTFSENICSLPEFRAVPLVGTIACGTPLLAEENISAVVAVPDFIHADFALRCKGDSMTGARIFDNDIVYVRKQDTVENGEIAAVLIDNEATLKRFYRYGDTVVLRAENPSYKELQYKKEELNHLKILGKAIYFLSKAN